LERFYCLIQKINKKLFKLLIMSDNEIV